MTNFKNNIKTFIAKYENEREKELLPLCVLSSNVHRSFKHSREIFNDFNKLNNEEQKQILKHFNVNFKCSLKENWINDGIKIIVDFIKENNLNNDNNKYLSFDFEKYLELSLKDYYANKYSNESDKFVNVFDKITNQNKNKISFSDYFDQYMATQIERDDKIVANIIPPFQYVILEENLFESNDEKNKCFWTLEILEVISAYIRNRDVNSSKLYETHVFDEISIDTFEDKHYQVLLLIYQIVELQP